MGVTYGSVVVLVFRQPIYAGLAVGLASAMFSLIMWLPNLSIILTIWQSTTATAFDKIAILWAIYGSLFTDYTFISGSFVVVLSVLFGVHISLLTYYIKQMRAVGGEVTHIGTGSLVGMLSASLGIGCAACGSLVLSSLFSLLGVGGIVAFLPLAGAEFGIIGVMILLYSTYLLLQKIAQPYVC